MTKQQILKYVKEDTVNLDVLSNMLDFLPLETVIYNVTANEDGSNAQLPAGVTVEQLMNDLSSGKQVLLRLGNDKYLLRYTNESNGKIIFSYTAAPMGDRKFYTNMQVSFPTNKAANKTYGTYLESVKQL